MSDLTLSTLIEQKNRVQFKTYTILTDNETIEKNISLKVSKQTSIKPEWPACHLTPNHAHRGQT